LRPGQVATVELLEPLRLFDVVDLTHREIDPHRIDLGHRGQQRDSVLPHQVAGAHAREPGDAAHRRADLRVREIERRLVQLRRR
jgi:hypothetical protein